MLGVQGAQKLKLWPQPDAEDPPELLSESNSLPELQPADLLDGALVNFRVARSTLDSGTALMPPGHVIKVPEALADSPAMRLRVRVEGAGTYTVILAVARRCESGEPLSRGDPSASGDVVGDAGAGAMEVSEAAAEFAAAAGIDPAVPPALEQQLVGGGCARPWRIIGLGDVLNAVHCSEADELCIEKCVPPLDRCPYSVACCLVCCCLSNHALGSAMRSLLSGLVSASVAMVEQLFIAIYVPTVHI